MTFRSLAQYLRHGVPAAGPIAILLIEDDAAVAQTLAHHLRIGFRHILALSPEPLPAEVIPPAAEGRIVNLHHDSRQPLAHVAAVNAVIQAAAPRTWLYYGYNAEFLFYPFAESRSVGEMLAFHAEERRQAMLSYVIDLYAPDLQRWPDAVSLDQAMFDRLGYYALARCDRDGRQLERQLDFHGGLRWRFEEHIPADRRRIDRIALFQARPDLRLLPDHRFNIAEYNTYACPWHHNLTAAIASFRVAKALARNPGSRWQISGFRWRNSTPFQWNSQQLMDLGLMEPGQWF
ncbi:glycosyltransferase family 2 protein [Paracoccus sp. SMMA_5]|uniref:glycosyltransferase family 2 protein n=1 Tax=Paracoccus sp. SMMA_5 TaxID=2654281 RepID=UPI0012B2942A|nr:glycosyltransferase family 2 protein [Paracoccus sp. SMMA_5]UXU73942.1 glycosyltransferase family 2 protein [Paracoccus sp. SMMA_5]